MSTISDEIHFNLPDLNLVYIEGGHFLMGDQTGDLWEACGPVHSVRIDSFYLGKYQVTQRLWEKIMGSNPARFKGERHPVERVSWDDVQIFIAKLNQKTGKAFRLPSESEWEYAARGGIYSQGYQYAGSDKLIQVGWYDENSNGGTHEVGQKLANELGVYDMSGNVEEWCEDNWHDNYESAPEDGSAWVDNPKLDNRQVIRGGGCFVNAIYCRSAYRFWVEADAWSNEIGFRLALSLQSAR